jgi:hypothetical protein
MFNREIFNHNTFDRSREDVFEGALSHGITHRLPADQVNVQVEDGLIGIAPGVDNQSVAGMLDTLFSSELAGDSEQVPDQAFIAWGNVIHGSDVLVRYDQYMRRGGGVDVVKGSRLVIPVYDLPRLLGGHNTAECAVFHM